MCPPAPAPRWLRECVPWLAIRRPAVLKAVGWRAGWMEVGQLANWLALAACRRLPYFQLPCNAIEPTWLTGPPAPPPARLPTAVLVGPQIRRLVCTRLSCLHHGCSWAELSPPTLVPHPPTRPRSSGGSADAVSQWEIEGIALQAIENPTPGPAFFLVRARTPTAVPLQRQHFRVLGFMVR